MKIDEITSIKYIYCTGSQAYLLAVILDNLGYTDSSLREFYSCFDYIITIYPSTKRYESVVANNFNDFEL